MISGLLSFILFFLSILIFSPLSSPFISDHRVCVGYKLECYSCINIVVVRESHYVVVVLDFALEVVLIVAVVV